MGGIAGGPAEDEVARARARAEHLPRVGRGDAQLPKRRNRRLERRDRRGAAAAELDGRAADVVAAEHAPEVAVSFVLVVDRCRNAGARGDRDRSAVGVARAHGNVEPLERLALRSIGEGAVPVPRGHPRIDGKVRVCAPLRRSVLVRGAGDRHSCLLARRRRWRRRVGGRRDLAAAAHERERGEQRVPLPAHGSPISKSRASVSTRLLQHLHTRPRASASDRTRAGVRGMSLHPATSSSVDRRSIGARSRGDTTQAELSAGGPIGWAKVLKRPAISRTNPSTVLVPASRRAWPDRCDKGSP